VLVPLYIAGALTIVPALRESVLINTGHHAGATCEPVRTQWRGWRRPQTYHHLGAGTPGYQESTQRIERQSSEYIPTFCF
jgi:hypothetical protein